MSEANNHPSMFKSSSLFICVGLIVLFLIVVCVVEWQFNKVHRQMERLRLNMIRELDRDNLVKIIQNNDDDIDEFNSSYRHHHHDRKNQ